MSTVRVQVESGRRGIMLSLSGSIDTIAQVIRVALTPVFLLSGIASLLGVFSMRHARVADRFNILVDRLESAGPAERRRLQQRLAFLRRRSHALDAAVMLGTTGGAATCLAILSLFLRSLRNDAGAGFLAVLFALALLCTAGALGAFLTEMLLASRGMRDQIVAAEDGTASSEAPEL